VSFWKDAEQGTPGTPERSAGYSRKRENRLGSQIFRLAVGGEKKVRGKRVKAQDKNNIKGEEKIRDCCICRREHNCTYRSKGETRREEGMNTTHMHEEATRGAKRKRKLFRTKEEYKGTPVSTYLARRDEKKKTKDSRATSGRSRSDRREVLMGAGTFPRAVQGRGDEEKDDTSGTYREEEKTVGGGHRVNLCGGLGRVKTLASGRGRNGRRRGQLGRSGRNFLTR